MWPTVPLFHWAESPSDWSLLSAALSCSEALSAWQHHSGPQHASAEHAKPPTHFTLLFAVILKLKFQSVALVSAYLFVLKNFVPLTSWCQGNSWVNAKHSVHGGLEEFSVRCIHIQTAPSAAQDTLYILSKWPPADIYMRKYITKLHTLSCHGNCQGGKGYHRRLPRTTRTFLEKQRNRRTGVIHHLPSFGKGETVVYFRDEGGYLKPQCSSCRQDNYWNSVGIQDQR